MLLYNSIVLFILLTITNLNYTNFYYAQLTRNNYYQWTRASHKVFSKGPAPTDNLVPYSETIKSCPSI